MQITSRFTKAIHFVHANGFSCGARHSAVGKEVGRIGKNHVEFKIEPPHLLDAISLGEQKIAVARFEKFPQCAHELSPFCTDGGSPNLTSGIYSK